VSKLVALATAALAALSVSACGSSGNSSQARSLLRQTFSGSHTVNSGQLTFNLTVNPSGSGTLKGPITVGFGGPFDGLGTGKLPKSNFTVSLNLLGRTLSLGILSTGSAGYVTASGTSYQLPASTFQQLESGFASLTSSAGSRSGGLSKLGINPLHWLINPSVAGNDTVAGASTTHIRAGIDVRALLDDLNTFLGKAPALGVTGVGKIPSGISPATRDRLARDIRQPSVEIWTGSNDKTLRKLALSFSLPVNGQLSALLGSSTQIALTMQYAELNQPQTIVAPTSVAPYSQFQAKLRSVLSAVQGTVTGSGLSGSGSSGTGSTGTGSTGPSSSGSSGASALGAYSQCLQKAGGDITKAQQCAALLNGQ
jgi:hypothetical protein